MPKWSNYSFHILLTVLALFWVPVADNAYGQDPAGTAQQDTAVFQTNRIGEAPQLTTEEKIAQLNDDLLRNPADSKSWNDLGVIYAGEGDFGLARDSFIKAVQSEPTQGDYHRNLGMAFAKLDMYDLAVSEFQAYRQLDLMGGSDYWRLIGKAQMNSEQIPAARQTLQDGIDAMSPYLGPEGFRLVLMLDKIEFEAGDEAARKKLLETHVPNAVRFLQDNKQDDPGTMEARSLVHNRVGMMVDDAKILEESGMLDEAAEVFAAAYELAPERVDLLPRLVSVHIARDQMMDAKVAARLARGDHPENAGTWIASGRVYERVDRLEDALDCYQKAFAIDESIDDLRVVIGNLLMRMGRDAEAGKFLKDGVNPGTAQPEVVYNYAISQMREKKYHAAIAALKGVVVDRPEMTEAWIALGQSLQATKQYRQAMEPYGQALEQTGDPKYALLKGRCAQKAKRYAAAIAAYEEGLAMDAGYVKARYNLSLTYMDAKRYQDAVESFQKMLELEPDSYRVYFSMGRSYFHMGQYSEALDAFDMALELDETVNLCNSIGLVYDKQGKKKKAAFWYKKAKNL